MQRILEKKRVVITGGSRGIGKAIVERFLEQGAKVCFWGTNKEAGEALRRQLISQFEGSVHFVAVDVANTQAVEKAVGEATAWLGGDIEILINNAGITRDNLLMKLSESDWDEVIATNLKSIYNTCRFVIRAMVKARAGKIINISSVVGMAGNAGQCNYAASKAGILGFTKSLAKEYGSRGVTVNAVAPGFIETAMTDKLPQPVKEKILNEIPLARFGKTDEIANVVLFLASPMADYITGQTIAVDGGMVM